MAEPEPSYGEAHNGSTQRRGPAAQASTSSARDTAPGGWNPHYGLPTQPGYCGRTPIASDVRSCVAWRMARRAGA
jgi:hypothetical protein